MYEWVLDLVLIILIIWLLTQSKTYKNNQLVTWDIDSATVSSRGPLLAQIESPIEIQYGVQLTYPMAEVKLTGLGIPQATIQQKKPVIEENLKIINQLNQQSLQQKQLNPESQPPLFGINPNIIYTEKEFLSLNTGYVDGGSKILPGSPGPQIRPVVVNPKGVQDKVDNDFLPMYNQQNCGCCWIVSACNVLNYQLARQTKKTASISYPVYFNSCLDKFVPNVYQPSSQTTSGQARGCNGGLPNYVYEAVSDAKNLVVIPNTNNQNTVNPDAQVQNCSNFTESNSKNLPYPVKGFIGLTDDGQISISKTYFDPSQKMINPGQNQKLKEQIKTALELNGPMTIAIDAQGSNLSSYNGGNIVLPNSNPDHAVLLIGYEKDEYWKIQNSWGVGWGASLSDTSRKGFFRADMNQSFFTCICGIVYEGSPLEVNQLK